MKSINCHQIFCHLLFLLCLFSEIINGQSNSDECVDGVETFMKSSTTRIDARINPIATILREPDRGLIADCSRLCQQQPTCSLFTLDYERFECLAYNQRDIIDNYRIFTPETSLFDKICLKIDRSLFSSKCGDGHLWPIERVNGAFLDGYEDMRLANIDDRVDCGRRCLIETSFVCRSAYYNRLNRQCVLSREDRRTQYQAFRIINDSNLDYLENQCASPGPCSFTTRMNSTVNSKDLLIYAPSAYECEQACIKEKSFICRSYSYQEQRCYLSSDDAISLSNLPQPAANSSLYGERKCALEQCSRGLDTYERIPRVMLSSAITTPLELQKNDFNSLSRSPSILFSCRTTCDRLNLSCPSFTLDYRSNQCQQLDRNSQGRSDEFVELKSVNYYEKICLRGDIVRERCEPRLWSFDRLIGFKLDDRFYLRQFPMTQSRRICEERCLQETEFDCRSALYEEETTLCRLSNHDRRSLIGLGGSIVSAGNSRVSYLENQCANLIANDPCVYRRIAGDAIPVSIDAIERAASVKECIQICERYDRFVCWSLGYEEESQQCLLSSDDRSTSEGFRMKKGCVYYERKCDKASSSTKNPSINVIPAETTKIGFNATTTVSSAGGEGDTTTMITSTTMKTTTRDPFDDDDTDMTTTDDIIIEVASTVPSRYTTPGENETATDEMTVSTEPSTTSRSPRRPLTTRKPKTTTEVTTQRLTTTGASTTRISTRKPTTRIITTEATTRIITTEATTATTRVTTRVPTTRLTTRPPTTRMTTQPTTRIMTKPPTTRNPVEPMATSGSTLDDKKGTTKPSTTVEETPPTAMTTESGSDDTTKPGPYMTTVGETTNPSMDTTRPVSNGGTTRPAYPTITSRPTTNGGTTRPSTPSDTARPTTQTVTQSITFQPQTTRPTTRLTTRPTIQPVTTVPSTSLTLTRQPTTQTTTTIRATTARPTTVYTRPTTRPTTMRTQRPPTIKTPRPTTVSPILTPVTEYQTKPDSTSTTSITSTPASSSSSSTTERRDLVYETIEPNVTNMPTTMPPNVTDIVGTMPSTDPTPSDPAHHQVKCGKGRRQTFERIPSFEPINIHLTILLVDKSNAGLLMDCLQHCQRNFDCMSLVIDYTERICYSVLTHRSIEHYQLRHAPGRDFYQGFCVEKKSKCRPVWQFDRVIDQTPVLTVTPRVILRDQSHQQCRNQCLIENRFNCLSAVYDSSLRLCNLYDRDRDSGVTLFFRKNVDYMENQCFREIDRCRLSRPERDLTLRTVMRVFAISSFFECQRHCLTENGFNCRSFTYVNRTQYRSVSYCLLSADDRMRSHRGSVIFYPKAVYIEKNCLGVRKSRQFGDDDEEEIEQNGTTNDDSTCDEVTFEKTGGFHLISNVERSQNFHVDPNVGLVFQCRKKCLQSGGKCHAFVVNYVNFHNCLIYDWSSKRQKIELRHDDATDYFEKICLKGSCNKFWTFDRKIGFKIRYNKIALLNNVPTREKCAQNCLSYQDSMCRSASYNDRRRQCRLYSETARTQANFIEYTGDNSEHYLENQCYKEASYCQYRSYVNVERDQIKFEQISTAHNVHECQQLCNSERHFICHSIYYDTNQDRCWLSSTAKDTNSLLSSENNQQNGGEVQQRTHGESKRHIIGPLPPQRIDTYVTFNHGLVVYSEKINCQNYKVTCSKNQMTLEVEFDSPFNGRLYVRNQFSNCFHLGNYQQHIFFNIKHDDPRCSTVRDSDGDFRNEVIIQHHPVILTDTDIMVKILCPSANIGQQFFLNPIEDERNAIDVRQVMGSPCRTPLQGMTRKSPLLMVSGTLPPANIRMRITRSNGSEVEQASLGDKLTMIIELLDSPSVFAIGVSNLIAKGSNGEQIKLIDNNGCPTDPLIFSGLSWRSGNVKTLIGNFKAFRFPASGKVNFEVTTRLCREKCPLPKCTTQTQTQINLKMNSGRRKRANLIENLIDLNSSRAKSTRSAKRKRQINTSNGSLYEQVNRIFYTPTAVRPTTDGSKDFSHYWLNERYRWPQSLPPGDHFSHFYPHSYQPGATSGNDNRYMNPPYVYSSYNDRDRNWYSNSTNVVLDDRFAVANNESEWFGTSYVDPSSNWFNRSNSFVNSGTSIEASQQPPERPVFELQPVTPSDDSGDENFSEMPVSTSIIVGGRDSVRLDNGSLLATHHDCNIGAAIFLTAIFVALIYSLVTLLIYCYRRRCSAYQCEEAHLSQIYTRQSPLSSLSSHCSGLDRPTLSTSTTGSYSSLINDQRRHLPMKPFNDNIFYRVSSSVSTSTAKTLLKWPINVEFNQSRTGVIGERDEREQPAIK